MKNMEAYHSSENKIKPQLCFFLKTFSSFNCIFKSFTKDILLQYLIMFHDGNTLNIFGCICIKCNVN